MLTELALPAYLDTSASDLIADFFILAQSHAIRYDGGVGYFSYQPPTSLQDDKPCSGCGR